MWPPDPVLLGPLVPERMLTTGLQLRVVGYLPSSPEDAATMSWMQVIKYEVCRKTDPCCLNPSKTISTDIKWVRILYGFQADSNIQCNTHPFFRTYSPWKWRQKNPPKRWPLYTDMRRLTTGIRSEKCVVRRFRRCANVIECTYTNQHLQVFVNVALKMVHRGRN